MSVKKPEILIEILSRLDSLEKRVKRHSMLIGFLVGYLAKTFDLKDILEALLKFL